MITRSKPIGENGAEGSFPARAPIPDGIHTATILSAEETLTASGIPYIDLKLEITGHENDRRIFAKLWLSEGKGNDDRNYDALLSCGHIPDPAGALPDPTPELFTHRTCRVRIGTNKRGYKDVTYWIPPKPATRTPTPHNITHDILAGPRSKPAFTRPSRTASPTRLNDDDIPF